MQFCNFHFSNIVKKHPEGNFVLFNTDVFNAVPILVFTERTRTFYDTPTCIIIYFYD